MPKRKNYKNDCVQKLNIFRSKKILVNVWIFQCGIGGSEVREHVNQITRSN